MQRKFTDLPYSVRCHQLVAIKIGLRTFATHGMKVNRDYTPKKMLEVAAWMTGESYKNSKSEMLRAAEDLQKLGDTMKRDEELRLRTERILKVNDSFGQMM